MNYIQYTYYYYILHMSNKPPGFVVFADHRIVPAAVITQLAKIQTTFVTGEFPPFASVVEGMDLGFTRAPPEANSIGE